MRLIPIVFALLLTACGAPPSPPVPPEDPGQPSSDAGSQSDAGDPMDAGENSDAGMDAGTLVDCGASERSAIFSPAGGGTPEDLSSTFAAGTPQLPVQHSLSGAGVLRLCGTWSVELTLDADVTVEGTPYATIDVSTRAMVVNAGRAVRLVDLELVNDGAELIRVNSGNLETERVLLRSRLIESNFHYLVALWGGTVNGTFRNTVFRNASYFVGAGASTSGLAGTFTFEDVVMEGFAAGGVQSATVDIVARRSNFTGTGTALFGGGDILVEDSVFTNVSPAIRGGLAGSSIVVRGSTVTGSGLAHLSGAVNVEVSDTTVTGPAIDNWSLLSVSDRATLTLEDVIFSGQRGGGGVRCDGCVSVVVTNSSFEDNQSEGGAIRFSGDPTGPSELRVTGTTFSNNRHTTTSTTGNGGGAIQLTRGDLHVESCVFNGNTSGGSGGAIFAPTFPADAVLITQSTFTSNEAQGGNGGALVLGDNVVVSDSTFSRNAASSQGGALHVGGYNQLSRLSFDDNGASAGGAAFIQGMGTYFAESSFSKNRAGTYGGAVGTAQRVEFHESTFGDGADENLPHEYGNGNFGNGVWAGVDLDGWENVIVCENGGCSVVNP